MYYSYTPDPHCTHVDAFVIDWLPELLFYSFPPFSCVGRTIDKLSRDGATSLLIFPMWTSQPWFPRLLDLLVSSIYIIPGLPIYLPWDHTIQHPSPVLFKCVLSSSWAILINSGVSQRPAELQLERIPAKRLSASKVYFKKWLRYTSQREVNPHSPLTW